MDDEIPYRSPVDVRKAEAASTQDENDFSTLLQLQKDINDALASLKSVDVFDLAEGELTVKEQIAAYRLAIQLIEPLQATINSTVDSVKLKQQEGQS